MAVPGAKARPLPTDDELDDILNGIAEERDIPSTSDNQARSDFPTKGSGTAGDGLGIDEEIIVTKKRIPIPKLDEKRLLSDPGIPRLQRISKERLRFKGKGHEYGDIARMLNMYQLWLDDLYPRAKFADALAIIEKVGHTKRMQMMRKEWIDAGKPRRTTEQEDEDADEVVLDRASAESTTEMEVLERDRDARQQEPMSGRDGQGQARDQTTSGLANDPDEDELDALLAESAQLDNSPTKTLPTRTRTAEEDLFADEMEAMADMEHMW